MTFITTTRIHTALLTEYLCEFARLQQIGYRVTRDYEAATHFNKLGMEVVLIKDFIKEVD